MGPATLYAARAVQRDARVGEWRPLSHEPATTSGFEPTVSSERDLPRPAWLGVVAACTCAAGRAAAAQPGQCDAGSVALGGPIAPQALAARQPTA